MTIKTWGWLLACALLLTTPSAHADDAGEAAASTGSHCLGEDCGKLILDQLLGARLIPVGIENRFDLGVCLPLVRNPHPLLAYTNLRFGAVNYVSPTYAHLGGFVAISPISILEFRAEASGLALWPTPFDRTGYQVVDDYEASFSKAALPASAGTSAWGFFAAFKPTLRARVGLGSSPLSLVVNAGLPFEFWKVGDQEYYYNCRRDLVLAQQDWLLANTAIVAIEIPVHPNATLMLGGMDDLNYVPSSKYLDHMVSGVISIRLDRLGKGMRDFQPFVTVGAYEKHAEFDDQLWIGIGIAAAYPLKTLGGG